MFQAFIDGSGNGGEREKVFVLAGYIATAENWAGFSREWGKLIKTMSEDNPRRSYFKMKEMKRRPADLARSALFYRVIEHYVTAAVSCVILVPDLIKAVRVFPWPSCIRNVDSLRIHIISGSRPSLMFWHNSNRRWA